MARFDQSTFSGRRMGVDYAKLSLALGVVSLVGAAAYWYWQARQAEAEARYHKKYIEVKKSISDLQGIFGLPPTGRLDEDTRSLLNHLAESQSPDL